MHENFEIEKIKFFKDIIETFTLGGPIQILAKQLLRPVQRGILNFILFMIVTLFYNEIAMTWNSIK